MGLLSRNQGMGFCFCVLVGTVALLSVMHRDGSSSVVAGSSASHHRKLREVQDACAPVGELLTEDLQPRMTAAEIALFTKYLSQAQYYFETGSGGSTFLASKATNLARIDVVESDLSWLARLRTYEPVFNAMCRDKKLHMHHVDINGNPNQFGHPMSTDLKSMWPVYSSAITLYTGSPWDAKPDLVFVDGRFRVAAAMYAYRVVEEGAFIMIHDYSDRRAYHIVEQVMTKVETADTLAVFVVGNRTAESLATIERLLSAHVHTPA